VKSVEVSWIDSTGKPFAYKLESVTDSTWKMLAPQDSNRVKNAMGTEMATRFAEMSVDEFVGAADTNLAKVKLDSPSVWVKVGLKNGKVGLKNGTVHELKASKTLGGYAYTQHPAHKDLIKLSAWRFDSFKKKPFELLEAPPAPKVDSTNPADAIKIEPAAAPAPAKPQPAVPAPKP
jgi:hypothetical protein